MIVLTILGTVNDNACWGLQRNGIAGLVCLHIYLFIYFEEQLRNR